MKNPEEEFKFKIDNDMEEIYQKTGIRPIDILFIAKNYALSINSSYLRELKKATDLYLSILHETLERMQLEEQIKAIKKDRNKNILSEGEKASKIKNEFLNVLIKDFQDNYSHMFSIMTGRHFEDDTKAWYDVIEEEVVKFLNKYKNGRTNNQQYQED